MRSGLTDFQNSEWERFGRRKVKAHHPLRSARPLHRESVLTILSMSFFHSMPSDVTRYHSLHTSSAAHSDLASKYDRMFSAIWSRPRALVGREKEAQKKNRGGAEQFFTESPLKEQHMLCEEGMPLSLVWASFLLK